ncbi:hypothetical protein CGRA01v4_12646 [Colletotrichum graminicola]|nr:hypothetical protein CGRA01v4_12646 [Colletotrichum graminicola]
MTNTRGVYRLQTKTNDRMPKKAVVGRVFSLIPQFSYLWAAEWRKLSFIHTGTSRRWVVYTNTRHLAPPNGNISDYKWSELHLQFPLFTEHSLRSPARSAMSWFPSHHPMTAPPLNISVFY